jgi:hypothetical protein
MRSMVRFPAADAHLVAAMPWRSRKELSQLVGNRIDPALRCARQHPHQRAVAKYVVVHQRRSGVDPGKDQKRIGEKLMHFQQASRG